jgi:DNA-binding response OmpR family regulator
MMSALSDRLDEIALEVGAAGYLSKPFDLDQLLAALKELSSG